MEDNGQIFETAVQIRSAREATREVEDYVSSMRLALEGVQASNVDIVRTLRDEMIELQKKTAEALLSLTAEISELVAAIGAIEPVVVNVPETVLSLEQQPPIINIPKSAIQVKVPAIKIPEPQVVIQGSERKLPKRLKIKHSDGTSSSVELEIGG